MLSLKLYFEMGGFRDSQGSGYMMMLIQFLIIELIAWLVWLCAIASAQLELSETLTGAVSFPDGGITCLGNIALFIASLLRGRFYLEMGVRDFMATVTGSAKLNDINGFGVTTLPWQMSDRDARDASVIMLSSDVSNSSMRQFMKYIYNTHRVNSILLKCLPVKSALKDASIKSELESASAEMCRCNMCNCIVLWTVEDITIMLAGRLPETLKRLSESMCLLPSLPCLTKGCHGYNQGLFQVEETGNEQRLTAIERGFPVAVCDALDFEFTTTIQEEPICICIPLKPAFCDDWTKLLMRSFKSKDKEDRGAAVMASDALENYLANGRRDTVEEVLYRTASLVVPRLAEVFINLVLTGWFKVDGFSSSLVARRAIKRYVVDSKGNGFAANAFLTSAVVMVKSNADNTSVCQVLSFRGTLLGIRALSFLVGCVNLICSFSWAMLIAFEGGTGKWYEIQAMSPSKPRIAVIVAAICIGLGMDCLELFSMITGERRRLVIHGRKRLMLWAVIVFEILCIVSCSAVAGTLGVKKGFGRWVYSALQGLVWVKWGIGSYLLGDYSPEHVHRPSSTTTLDSGLETLDYSSAKWVDHGSLVYSSAFLLNAVLAGVRGNWK